MAELTVVLAVLAATVLAVPLADRLSLPYPILLLQPRVFPTRIRAWGDRWTFGAAVRGKMP